MSDPGFLEGGDFYPAGKDLCFVGVGLRSNLAACMQLMEQDWFGTDRVAIVNDEFDHHQVPTNSRVLGMCDIPGSNAFGLRVQYREL